YAAGQTGTVARALLSLVAGERLARGPYAEAHAAQIEALPADASALENAATTAHVELAALRALARELAGARGAVILYDEMATREPSGATLAEDVLRLALFTDNLGRPGTGAGPLFEDNNSLGARDMGLLPDLLPGYRPVSDLDTREGLPAAWGRTVPAA